MTSLEPSQVVEGAADWREAMRLLRRSQRDLISVVTETGKLTGLPAKHVAAMLTYQASLLQISAELSAKRWTTAVMMGLSLASAGLAVLGETNAALVCLIGVGVVALADPLTGLAGKEFKLLLIDLEWVEKTLGA